jgi:hypothetical protein
MVQPNGSERRYSTHICRGDPMRDDVVSTHDLIVALSDDVQDLAVRLDSIMAEVHALLEVAGPVIDGLGSHPLISMLTKRR